MEAHPKYQEWVHSTSPQKWTIAGKVVQVFRRVHTYSREGFRVGIPMMDGMAIFVQEPSVQHSMAKVKVYLSNHRCSQAPNDQMKSF
jgi:hypothetical protein